MLPSEPLRFGVVRVRESRSTRKDGQRRSRLFATDQAYRQPRLEAGHVPHVEPRQIVRSAMSAMVDRTPTADERIKPYPFISARIPHGTPPYAEQIRPPKSAFQLRARCETQSSRSKDRQEAFRNRLRLGKVPDRGEDVASERMGLPTPPRSGPGVTRPGRLDMLQHFTMLASVEAFLVAADDAMSLPDCGASDHASLPSLSRVDPETLDRAAAIFRAMGDAGRLRILAVLSQRAMCVTELAETLGENLSTISQRLKLLRSERLARSRRDGKHVIYSLADQHVALLVANALDHAVEPHGADRDESAPSAAPTDEAS